MNQCFAYIRVSTAKQGEQGVSLQEQRGAITRYAERCSLKIIEWYEERETAAKRGRPVFTQMLKRLKKAEADGVIIHKIDRSARNLRDWADLGEMIDKGIEVYFANESLDLHTRGGRLSADIQAVVAADFIRNLREETRKGFYGRIKQGLFPLPAPVGYLDQGKGKPKIPDPLKAPLIRKLFDLYATGQYSLPTLVPAAAGLGLRNRNGRNVMMTSLSTILNNPFYIGMIHLRRTKETFPGCHDPIVKPAVFNRVQSILRGKTVVRLQKHDFLFRRMLKCGRCGYSLVGELKKGNVYYRCHTSSCPQKGIREDDAHRQIAERLKTLVLNEAEQTYIRNRVSTMKLDWKKTQEAQERAVNLSLKTIDDRLNRLTDVFLDSAIDREMYDRKKTALLLEKAQLADRIKNLLNGNGHIPDMLAEFLELAGMAYLSYEMAIPEEKRTLVTNVTSNCLVNEKNVVVELRNPFQRVALRLENINGAPYRGEYRTADAGIGIESKKEIARIWDPLILRLSDILSKEPMTFKTNHNDSSSSGIAA